MAKSKRGFRPGRVVGRAVLLLAGAGLLALAVTVLQVWWLKEHYPKKTSWMLMRRAQAEDAGKTFRLRYSYVPLRQMPRHLPKAVIAAEDDGFYVHRGFDWDAIKKAYKHNEKKGKIKRGGSTITQQLAKNLFLSPKRSYIRKVREGIITVLMERMLSKSRILELYLNCIEFGPGVFGVEEAARYHFGVSAQRLTLNQSCRLAAIIPSPLKYRVNGPYVIRRAARIERAIR